MVRSNLRVAAGVGVVAAFVLIGGPSAAVAVAGPGGSHSGHSDKHGGSDNVTRGPAQSDFSGAPQSKVGSGRDAGTSIARPGNGFSPDPPGHQFKPPKVTFGDGRTPGIQNHETEPRWGGNAPEPAPPPPPPPPPVIAPAPPRTDRVHEPRVIQQLVVAPTSALRDPSFGLTGLLLIPAAGAVLGYRQARAARGAEKLRGL